LRWPLFFPLRSHEKTNTFTGVREYSPPTVLGYRLRPGPPRGRTIPPPAPCPGGRKRISYLQGATQRGPGSYRKRSKVSPERSLPPRPDRLLRISSVRSAIRANDRALRWRIRFDADACLSGPEKRSGRRKRSVSVKVCAAPADFNCGKEPSVGTFGRHVRSARSVGTFGRHGLSARSTKLVVR